MICFVCLSIYTFGYNGEVLAKHGKYHAVIALNKNVETLKAICCNYVIKMPKSSVNEVLTPIKRE